ncbi:hypothetical protein F5Y19DRAFT_425088 [Xylariaceae sp. FL1651]|nr:hypothetical protein F5Y19DRAFT_425088 [Xylariaceae sp. FL1651]
MLSDTSDTSAYFPRVVSSIRLILACSRPIFSILSTVKIKNIKMGVLVRVFRLSITNDIPSSALADLVVCSVFAIHALFWVALRIGARVYTRTQLQFNDYAILWSILWGLALAANSTTTVSYGGLGHHISEIAELVPYSIEPMLKTVLVGQFTWALSNFGVKLSIIDLYVKLFGANQTFRRVAYFLMGCVTGYLLLVVSIAFALCRPFAFNWDQTIPGGYCGDQNSAFLASGILNLILDVAVIILPLPVLWNVHLARHKKIGLMLMFSMGTGIVGISIWRTILIVRLDKRDIFLTIGLLSVTTNLEPLLGICVACLPVCQALLVIVFRRIKSAGYATFSHLSNNQTCEYEASRPQQSSGEPASSVDRKNFKRLHDNLYRLHDFSAVTYVEGSSHNTEVDHLSEGQYNGIRVTETWKVVSQEQV